MVVSEVVDVGLVRLLLRDEDGHCRFNRSRIRSTLSALVGYLAEEKLGLDSLFLSLSVS